MATNPALDQALQDLAEAGFDVIEAEQEGSGQGSWGKAMVWQVFKDKYAAVKEKTMTNTPLNPDAVTRSIMGYQLRSSCLVEPAGECKSCRSVVEAIITDYLAVAQPVVNSGEHG